MITNKNGSKKIQDCLDRGKLKALTAAEKLQEIYPGVAATGESPFGSLNLETILLLCVLRGGDCHKTLKRMISLHCPNIFQIDNDPLTKN